jgi:RNA polymerase primary sigma factor
VEEKVVQEELKQSIQEMLEQLTPQEKKIIIMRFGLDGIEPKTLREIGEKLGISRERVRQLETRAKKKMKEHALRRKLNVFLN